MKALIAAISKNNVIGYQGKIPWKIKGEQKRFQELTTNKIVVMGRRTFEEIGKPLPNRKTILISNTFSYTSKECITLGSLREAFIFAKEEDIFIVGGAKLYKEAIPFVDKMYLTKIHKIVEGDVFFPYYDKNNFREVFCKTYKSDIDYTYFTLERIF